LLRAPDRRERLEKLAAERDSLYCECAHTTVRSSDISPARMALKAEKHIRQALSGVAS
jgi:shikimate kinase